MSSPPEGKTPSKGLTSSSAISASASVIAFACNHGDTILLGLPAGKWVLIDCHLPQGEIRNRFFQLVDALGIARLDYIFQTHPDIDHYLGMRSVLKYFTQPGRSIGIYGDSGFSAKQVRLLYGKRPESSEYERLQRELDRLTANDTQLLQYAELTEMTEPIVPNGHEDLFAIVPIGPIARLKRRITRTDLLKLARKKGTDSATNALSVVLVLSMGKSDAAANALLAADAEPEGLRESLRLWSEKAKTLRRGDSLSLIKVPHHGSFKNHVAEACRSSPAVSNKVAVVCCGTRDALPDRRVLQDYLATGWRVALTTRRTKQPSQRPFMLIDRGRSGVSQDSGSSDVNISLASGLGAQCDDELSVIGEESLTLYSEAVSH